MRCPSCDASSVLLDRLSGELICTRCGLVILEKLPDLGPEWRSRPDEDAVRADVTAGVDVTRHDLGIGSEFDSSGELSPSWRARMRRLRMWQDRCRASSYGEKSLREALIELDKLCEDLLLPKAVKAEISSLYRKAKAARLTMGRGTWQVLAALTFIVCRQRGLPRAEGEVVRALKVRAGLSERIALKSLRRFSKLLSKELKLEVPRACPEDYLDRFATQLNLSRPTVARAHELCRAVPDRLKNLKPATLLAGAVLYLAAEATGEKVTMRKLASAVGIGVSSLCKTASCIREIIACQGG